MIELVILIIQKYFFRIYSIRMVIWMNFIIEYWLQIVFGLCVSFVGYLYRQIQKYRRKLISAEKAISILLKQSIIHLYEDVKYKDIITVNEKEKINELYHEYDHFGCCEIVEDIMINLEKKKIE